MDNKEANFLLCVYGVGEQQEQCWRAGVKFIHSHSSIHSFHKPLLFLKARLLPVQDPEKILIQLGRP